MAFRCIQELLYFFAMLFPTAICPNIPVFCIWINLSLSMKIKSVFDMKGNISPSVFFSSYLKTISEKTGVHVVKSPPELNYNQSRPISNHPIFHLLELFDCSTRGERLLLHRSSKQMWSGYHTLWPRCNASGQELLLSSICSHSQIKSDKGKREEILLFQLINSGNIWKIY